MFISQEISCIYKLERVMGKGSSVNRVDVYLAKHLRRVNDDHIEDDPISNYQKGKKSTSMPCKCAPDRWGAHPFNRGQAGSSPQMPTRCFHLAPAVSDAHSPLFRVQVAKDQAKVK